MVSRTQLVFAAALALLGCRGDATEQPMAGDLELCCKAANPDNVSFVGCRATGHCRASESVWVRGPVSCTAGTPQECAGGRCCRLVVDGVESPLASREPGSAAVAAPPAPAPEPAPAPAPVTPVPLDWQPLAKPVTVAKLVCPATVERGVAGTVVMQVEVDASGRVTAVEVREGFDPQCDALARDALVHAEFEPARTPAGEPVASSLRYEYEFARAEAP